MEDNLFTGSLVRLVSTDPEGLAKIFSRWEQDSEYARLLHRAPTFTWSVKKYNEWFSEDSGKDNPTEFFFQICALEGDQLIGFIILLDIDWKNGDSWLAIGLGERDYWDKGFGTDAMRVLLRYAFAELNLHRLTLGVFAYNQRAIRSYEKVGFVVEGIRRKELNREGKRWDLVQMGILRREWEKAFLV